MGDGRYYTPEQFFNIILFATLIILVVIGFMLNLYKVDKNKYYIRALGSLMGVSLVSSFIAEVAYNKIIINIFSNLSNLSLNFYVTIGVVLSIKLFTTKNDIKTHFTIFTLLLLVPSLIYILRQETKNLAYIFYVVHFLILSNRFTKYKVSSSAFSNVKKLMLNYVFITSINGDIIFKNDNTLKSNIFRNIHNVDVESVSDLFAYETAIRKAFSKQFIKVDGDKILFFQYHKKEILDKDKIAGYILTFVDITNLIAMLDKLSEKQEETKKINDELIRYKEIVYDIEKEKEINNLLDEIAENQQKSMYELKKQLGKLDINDESFLNKVDNLSEKAKVDLKDVREAVTSYIEYYE